MHVRSVHLSPSVSSVISAYPDGHGAIPRIHGGVGSVRPPPAMIGVPVSVFHPQPSRAERQRPPTAFTDVVNRDVAASC